MTSRDTPVGGAVYENAGTIGGFWDPIKAALDRLKKVKPVQVLAREAGYDPSRSPQLDVSYAQPREPGKIFGLEPTTALIAGGALLFLLARRR